MTTNDWTRIPLPINAERDLRELIAILGATGLEVRIVKEKLTPRGIQRRFVEYRITPQDGNPPSA